MSSVICQNKVNQLREAILRPNPSISAHICSPYRRIPSDRHITEPKTTRKWCKNETNPTLCDGEKDKNVGKGDRTTHIAPLIAFLVAPIEDGGLGWKPHKGHLERVIGYVSEIGLEQVTKTAHRCFEEGNDGGAALWDWTLSQKGFRR
jgi:hypothetical protein